MRLRRRRRGDERRYVDEQFMSSDDTYGPSIYSTSQEPTPEVERRYSGDLRPGQVDDLKLWPTRKMRRAHKHMRQQRCAAGASPTRRPTIPHKRETPFQPIKARDAEYYKRDFHHTTSEPRAEAAGLFVDSSAATGTNRRRRATYTNRSNESAARRVCGSAVTNRGPRSTRAKQATTDRP